MGNMNYTYIQTGLYKTYVNQAGRGGKDAILFIHGSGPGATAFSNWQYALPFFSEQGFYSLAPDLIGFGKSDHPDPPPHGARTWLKIWIEQLKQLLDALNIERAHVVGNSLGGAIALHLLLHIPERINRVVLMGSVGAPFRITTELDRIWGFYEDASKESMMQIIHWFAYDNGLLKDQLSEIVEMRLASSLQPEIRRSYEAMFPAPRQQHVDDLVVPAASLRKIEQPVLIIHGHQDPIIPVETSYYLSQHLPNMKMMIFGQCSHWTQIEHRNAFHQLVLQFLAGKI
ncbi:alpha/beta hydrolase [Geobacillus proteiniphilus]|uniref:Alpha/beta hydrolase n=1 Tax=Geobacillus proteiniphilus TaxID=860353 RepID=A0ABY9ME25_9BACL|nr:MULTISPECIES: alpha/beta hydrolase [Geobacillus]OPX04569.1 2-hydroxy-6-oxo-6-phenylhexa-2,4-dienoate hydrolase [Geobacillus sp. LEMMY01]WMJ16250.1 alpha/beta hydrolase [Geobacillus proteiniphilus]